MSNRGPVTKGHRAALQAPRRADAEQLPSLLRGHAGRRSDVTRVIKTTDSKVLKIIRDENHLSIDIAMEHSFFVAELQCAQERLKEPNPLE